MKKNIIGILVSLLIAITALFGVAGCNDEETRVPAEPGLYSLQEAYDNGYLLKMDLKQIANYHNNGIPNPESLSEDIAQSIKKDWAKKYNEENTDQKEDITEEMVIVCNYYGTYNSCAVIIVDLRDKMYIGVYQPITVEVGNVKFNYDLKYPQIIVWKG